MFGVCVINHSNHQITLWGNGSSKAAEAERCVSVGGGSVLREKERVEDREIEREREREKH